MASLGKTISGAGKWIVIGASMLIIGAGIYWGYGTFLAPKAIAGDGTIPAPVTTGSTCGGIDARLTVSAFNGVDSTNLALNETVKLYVGASSTPLVTTKTDASTVTLTGIPVNSAYRVVLGDTSSASTGTYQVEFKGDATSTCLASLPPVGMAKYGNLTQIATNYPAQGYKDMMGGSATTIVVGANDEISVPMTIKTGSKVSYGKDGTFAVCASDGGTNAFDKIYVPEGTYMASIPTTLRSYQYCTEVKATELTAVDGQKEYGFHLNFKTLSTNPAQNVTVYIKDMATYIDNSGKVVSGYQDQNGNAVGFALIRPAGNFIVQ